MDGFGYCYLTPTLVGLVLFIAVIFAVVAVVWGLGWLYEYHLSNITVSKKAYEIINTTSTWALNIFGILLLLLLAAILLFGAWDVGIWLLKRVTCT